VYPLGLDRKIQAQAGDLAIPLERSFLGGYPKSVDTCTEIGYNSTPKSVTIRKEDGPRLD